MVRLITKPALVEAVMVGDILRRPAGDWSGLPQFVERMHAVGALTFHNVGAVLLEENHATTLLDPEDWIVQDAYGSISPVSSDDFQNRFYPREDARPEAPFKTGDVVKLTCGGFSMTVTDCRPTCSPAGFLVDVIWAPGAACSEFSGDTLSAACLTRTKQTNFPDIDGDIPF